MKVILLEIDTCKKKFLISKLTAVGLLAMKNCTGESDDLNQSDETWIASDQNSDKEYRERVEIYAEKNSISKIIKTIVTLARDGFLTQSPVEILSIRPAV